MPHLIGLLVIILISVDFASQLIRPSNIRRALATHEELQEEENALGELERSADTQNNTPEQSDTVLPTVKVESHNE